MWADAVVKNSACFLTVHSPDKIPICKSHINLLNFSLKEGIVYDEIYVESHVVHCTNCKAVEIVGIRD